MTNEAPLSYRTLRNPATGFAAPRPIPDGSLQIMPPMASTLIFGETDAVLVDPPLTIEHTRRIGDLVEASGKRLRHIVSTHGHADHWFGTGQLLDRFGGATALATPHAIALMRSQGSQQVRDALWDRIAPGEIGDTTVRSVPLDGGVFELEGQEVRLIEAGHTDTDDTSIVHVPSIGLVVAGDVVYDGVHPYLAESAGDGIDRWLEALDLVESLEPARVVSGHSAPTTRDDPATISWTRGYLLEARRLLRECSTSTEFFDAMIQRYPGLLATSTLWIGAVARLPESAQR